MIKSADRATSCRSVGSLSALDPFQWPVLALAPCLRQRFRVRVDNRVRLQGCSTLLGLDLGSVVVQYGLPSTILTTLDLADASPNFTTATIFNDSPTSGFGGWGNPSDDYQITTGAFANDFELAYPVPHRIRRNYTVRSLSADPFGDGTAPAPDDFWNYITPESQKQLINGYVGDYEGFQKILEGSTVS